MVIVVSILIRGIYLVVFVTMGHADEFAVCVISICGALACQHIFHLGQCATFGILVTVFLCNGACTVIASNSLSENLSPRPPEGGRI